MKIAILGDIQANLPALEAVLQHANAHGVEKFYSIGNILGAGSFPNETIQKLKIEKIPATKGTYDQKVLRIHDQIRKIKKSNTPDKWLLLLSIYDRLSNDNLSFLESIPEMRVVTIENKQILLLNQPLKDQKYSLKSLNQELPDISLKNIPYIIVYSKQRYPLRRKIDSIWVINTGTVGNDFDHDNSAYYITIRFQFGLIFFRKHKVKYNNFPSRQKSWKINPFTFLKPLKTIWQTSQQISVSELHTNPLPQKTDPFNAVEQLMSYCLSCKYSIEHSRQTSKLALLLFDQLAPLHQLGKEERSLLEFGAMLHDIGWITGQQGHHRSAFNIITRTTRLPFAKRELYIIALLALYHRKITPDPHHLHFATLEPANRRLVNYLVSILRIADAFDRSHQSQVTNLTCTLTSDYIKIRYTSPQPAELEHNAVIKKGRFFEETFERKLVLEWCQT